MTEKMTEKKKEMGFYLAAMYTPGRGWWYDNTIAVQSHTPGPIVRSNNVGDTHKGQTLIRLAAASV